MKKILLSVLALLAFAASGTAQTLPSYVPANGLVGWWPFNGNANDESGNNNNGTVNGATLTADRFGNAGKAYGFDGIDDYLSFNSSNLPYSNSDRTISIWFLKKNNSSAWTHNALSYGSPSQSKAVMIGVANNNLLCAQGWEDDVLTSQASSNNWENMTFTLKQGIGTIYYNGTFLTSQNLQNWNTVQSVFYIGSRCDLVNSYFFGNIDDTGIWNRALSQQEITALYQGANTTASCPTFPASLTQGLVGYWPFCGNALDESGNNNHGTVNGATLTTDRFGNAGSAYGFSGTNWIDCGTSQTMALKKNFTLNCWGKTTINSNNMAMAGRWTNVENPPPYGTPEYCLYFSNNKVESALVTSNPPNEYVGANFNYYDNVWHFYSMSFDGTNNKLYIDGQLVANQIVASDDTIAIHPNKFVIGAYGIAAAPSVPPINWIGDLDDASLYNRVLSGQEITQLYNQGICQTIITVTDTLLIHTGITSYNPVAYGNTLKVWPNPTNTAITLDAGNLSSMQGWKYKVANTLGQTVVNETAINQQQTNISLSTWGGNGIYYLHLINPQGHAIEIKKIVLAP